MLARLDHSTGAARAVVVRLTVAVSLCGSAHASAADAEVDVKSALAPAQGPHVHALGSASVGRGLRFNNPYRLATPLGDDAESLSLSATYLDVGLMVTTGSSLEHGGAVHLAVAIDGIPQEVFTPGYVALLRLSPRWMTWGRLGTPIVLEPDASVGAELGLGLGVLLSAGFGFSAEATGSLFYGAATPDKSVSVIPIVALQLGVLVDLEVLP